MNPVLFEMIFGKKGSLFGFGRGTVPFILDGMEGFKTFKDTFVYKDKDGKYHEIQRIWNDDETIKD